MFMISKSNINNQYSVDQSLMIADLGLCSRNIHLDCSVLVMSGSLVNENNLVLFINYDMHNIVEKSLHRMLFH